MLRLVENSKANAFFGKPVFAEELFCVLNQNAISELNKLRKPVFFPRNRKIVLSGEFPSDILVFGEGDAILTLNLMHDGKKVIRKIKPGEIIGIAEMLAEFSYETEIIAVSDCFCDAISRADLLPLLENDSTISFRILEILGGNLQKSYLSFSSI